MEKQYTIFWGAIIAISWFIGCFAAMANAISAELAWLLTAILTAIVFKKITCK